MDYLFITLMSVSRLDATSSCILGVKVLGQAGEEPSIVVALPIDGFIFVLYVL